MNPKLGREERETIIRGNAASRVWEVVTADPRIKRLMARRGYQPDERENPWGYISFTVPFGRIRISKREKSRRGFAATKNPTAQRTNAEIEGQNPKAMV